MPSIFRLTGKQMNEIIDNLDKTGGYLIKESELRYWIEYFANKHHSSATTGIPIDKLKEKENDSTY